MDIRLVRGKPVVDFLLLSWILNLHQKSIIAYRLMQTNLPPRVTLLLEGGTNGQQFNHECFPNFTLCCSLMTTLINQRSISLLKDVSYHTPGRIRLYVRVILFSFRRRDYGNRRKPERPKRGQSWVFIYPIGFIRRGEKCFICMAGPALWWDETSQNQGKPESACRQLTYPRMYSRAGSLGESHLNLQRTHKRLYNHRYTIYDFMKVL